MASLQFFRLPLRVERPPIEWGTGKKKKKLFDAGEQRNPTWLMSGEPTEQKYQETLLKLSRNRINDELVPRPQAFDVGKKVIKLPFPMEHPNSSHMSRFALFPKFDSSEDPKRGVLAREQRPISSEMPAHPDKVTVFKKIKGHGVRHEFVEPTAVEEKKALYWTGEEDFDQEGKAPGKATHPEIYPTPPKMMCPNLQDRSGDGTESRPDQRLSERTANVLRNAERSQWMTTYQLQYSGMGPHHPMELDNLEEKKQRMAETGVEDHSLRPMSYNVFDPTRPIDGHLRRNVCPLPIHTASHSLGPIYRDEYTGPVSVKDRGPQRLLYGADYLNVPDVSQREVKTCPHVAEAVKNSLARDHDTSTIPKLKVADPSDPSPGNKPRVTVPVYPVPVPHEGEVYMQQLRVQQARDIQQMEARNRWKVLEAQTPAHDLRQLRHKMEKLKPEEQPAVFYKHEGRYNEERAGMYKTSYDPHKLTDTMTPDPEDPRDDHLVNYTLLNPNVEEQFNLSKPAYRLKENMDGALKWSRTYNRHIPELSGDRRDWPEVMNTFRQLKKCQRRRLLPPCAEDASVRVQERELIEARDTSMGISYNVPKFLQERALRPLCREDPTTLMSHANQDLERVRSQTVPRPSKESEQMNPWPGNRSPRSCTGSSITSTTDIPGSSTQHGVHTLGTRVFDQLAETKGVIDRRSFHAPPLYTEDPNFPPPKQMVYERESTSEDGARGPPPPRPPPKSAEPAASTQEKTSEMMKPALGRNDTAMKTTTTTTTTTTAPEQFGTASCFLDSLKDTTNTITAAVPTRKFCAPTSMITTTTTTTTTTTSGCGKRVRFNDNNNSFDASSQGKGNKADPSTTTTNNLNRSEDGGGGGSNSNNDDSDGGGGGGGGGGRGGCSNNCNERSDGGNKDGASSTTNVIATTSSSGDGGSCNTGRGDSGADGTDRRVPLRSLLRNSTRSAAGSSSHQTGASDRRVSFADDNGTLTGDGNDNNNNNSTGRGGGASDDDDDDDDADNDDDGGGGGCGASMDLMAGRRERLPCPQEPIAEISLTSNTSANAKNTTRTTVAAAGPSFAQISADDSNTTSAVEGNDKHCAGAAAEAASASAANSNNNFPEDEHASSVETRFRSYPRRIPGTAHGHGLLDTEYTHEYRGFGFHNAILQSAPKIPNPYHFPDFDLSYKDNDPRFVWHDKPGIPRPQTQLLKIQDSFFKTQAMREFDRNFPDTTPRAKPVKKGFADMPKF